MKKIYLLCLILFAFTSLTMAQTIENFESLKMSHFSAGTNGSVGVVANPDPSGINTSANVGQLTRNSDGDPWAGWYATLPTPVDVTANKYVHVKIYKSRISPVVFKYERTGGDSGDVYSLNPQTKTDEWEELVFDMSKVSGNYVKIVFIPDFENPITITSEVTIYFDDFYVNNDPTVGSAPVTLMEDYENITLNPMLAGADDASSFSLLPNPYKTELNSSDYVIEFLRDKNGNPWGGFWSKLPTPIDVTVNKYVHVKVWKSRISPLKFKIEGGAAGNLEVASMSPQTKTGVWEDIVFDFSSKTGTYPIIAFMPDFEDPLTLTQDLVIYFDDIVLNNVPSSAVPPQQTIEVDMSNSGMTTGSTVWISGTMGGSRGTWAEPGTIAQNEMLDPDGDGIYTINFSLADGGYEYKFFWNTGWANGDNGPGNRAYTVSGNTSLYYEWGVDGFTETTSAKQLSGTSFKVFPNPVTNMLTIQSPDMKGLVVSDLLGRTIRNYQFQAVNSKQVDLSGLQSGIYLITVKTNDGTYTSKVIKQ
ncbi:MAG TPA: T9SS type A sorting domain-containing protein [Prolixibacteraceae bacterium]|jgi:hypothetical protein